MRMPDDKEKREQIKSFRSLFIKIVAPKKRKWEELTKREQKQVDECCKRYFNMLVF